MAYDKCSGDKGRGDRPGQRISRRSVLYTWLAAGTLPGRLVPTAEGDTHNWPVVVDVAEVLGHALVGWFGSVGALARRFSGSAPTPTAPAPTCTPGPRCPARSWTRRPPWRSPTTPSVGPCTYRTAAVKKP
jgi:hypothetical protein